MLPYVNESKEEEERPESPSFYKQKEKKVSWSDKFLLNRESKVIFVFVVVALIAPFLLYYFVISEAIDRPPRDGFSMGSCLIPRISRIACGYGSVPENECHPECCYDLRTNFCFHRLPSRFSYIASRSWSEELLLTSRQLTEPFVRQPTINNLAISINEISVSHLSFTIYNTEIVPPITGSKLDHTQYTYSISVPEILIEVNGPQGLIFTTTRGPLIASDNIWEMAFKLTNDTMFGLGEIPLNFKTVKIIYSHENDADSIPVIFAKSNDTYHGFLIENPTPTEINITEDNQITLRSLTLDYIKFHLFVGPEPSDIMTDVKKFIGFNNQIETWMLGTHVCREVAPTLDVALEELVEFIKESNSDQMLFESHCGISPIVFNSYCNLEEEGLIESAIELLHKNNKKFVPHVSPYIHMIDNTSSAENLCPNFIFDFKNYFIEKTISNMYIGSVGDKNVIYPDYETVTKDFMKEIWTLSSNIEGVILENNWPLDTSLKFLNETYLALPYFNERFETAFENTLQWDTIRPSNNEKYFYQHNKYGNNFVKAVNNFTGSKFDIFSTSQWLNGDVILNRQNVNTSWASLRRELVQASLGGVSGHWFWSVPICGDMEDFDESIHTDLCLKWYMAATYLPLIKIHSKSTVRDPMAFEGVNKNLMLRSLNTRRSFIPHFYTILRTGPLLRPMFYQFPRSESLIKLNTQFSVGDDLLIVPNLLPSQSHVNVWMPPGDWYELWSGMRLNGEEGEAVRLATVQSDFIVLIEGGKIIALQKEAEKSYQETLLPSCFSLIIALKSFITETKENIAEGKLYIGKETNLIFTANGETLTIKANGSDFSDICDAETASMPNVLKELNIYGLLTHNNHDHMRRVNVNIDLCELQTNNEIIFNFISDS